jgi:DNA-binding MarR family transcriptional regulator
MPSHLQRELKKKRPFDSPQQEAILNVLRTADRFQIQLARFCREFGLTPSQYNVLRILRGEDQPLPCLEIANRLITAVPAITGLIDRLEKMGLVHRNRSTDDRRVVFISPTPQALDLLARMDEPLDQLHHQLVGHLSPADLRELSRLLECARNPGTAPNP